LTTAYRVLAVAATPFFVDRGGHIHIYEPIKALQTLGHQVTLVTYHIGRDLPGLDIRRIPRIPWYGKTDAGPSYHKTYLTLLLLLKTLWVAWRLKPHILHAHGWDGLWVAWWVGKLLGIPFLFDMQGSFSGEIAEHGYAHKNGWYFRFLAWIERLSLHAAPLILTSSSQICQDACARFGLSEQKISVIMDGVDTDALSPQRFPPDPQLRAALNLPEKPTLIFMGLLKSYQGIDDLLAALHILVYERQFSAFHCLILGFPDEDAYRQLAAQKGLADFCTFTGRIAYEEIGRYLALADVAVAPKISMTEGDGKIYNYMAMALPVVAYDRPASREILGELGIYATLHNPPDLARALHETLNQPEQHQPRGTANRHKAEREYSWQAVAQRIIAAYDSVMTTQQTEPTGRKFWRWFRLLMGMLGLAALLSFVDLTEVKDTLAQANPIYLLPAGALILLSTGFKTLRWYLLLQQEGVAITLPRLLGTYLIGSFYSQFLPGSSAGGDAMRMAESSIDTGRAVDSVASVIIERAVGLISILCSASLILLLTQPADIPIAFSLTIYGLSVAGIIALLVLRFEWFLPLVVLVLGRLRLQKLGTKLQALSHALGGELGNPRLLAQMVVLSLLANACSMTAFYMALVTIIDPVPYLTFISLVSLIVTIEAVPLTPGSLGIHEGAYVFFLGYMGISQADALSIGLLIRVLNWIHALVGGVVLLGRGLR